jgi:hypothetical protein
MFIPYDKYEVTEVKERIVQELRAEIQEKGAVADRDSGGIFLRLRREVVKQRLQEFAEKSG